MTAEQPRRRPRKRGAGEGSVWKRARGGWGGSVMVGRKSDGTPDRRSVGGKTRAEVVKKLDELRRLAAGGLLTEPHKLTVAEYLAQWLRDIVVPARRERTATTWRGLIRRQVNPHIGALKLTALRPVQVQALYATLLAAGLAPGTVRMVHTLLHSACKQAVKWRYLAVNPVDGATPPAASTREMQTLTAEQVRLLISTAEAAGDRYAPLWRLMTGTGCRIGEALALIWEDIDLERGTVTIRRTLIGVERDGAPRCNPPKTKRSARTVSVSPATVAALRGQRTAILEERLRAGKDYLDYGLAFPTSHGCATRNTAVLEALHRALTRAGLPLVRTQDLRHTMATVALTEGINPRVVADRLGHSDVALTLRIYTHVTASMEREATARLAAALGG